MRHQTITIQVPDDEQWVVGDHIPMNSLRGVLVVGTEEPVNVLQRQTFDLSISIDVDYGIGLPTTADQLAAFLRNWLVSPAGPFDRPRQRDLQVVVLGEQIFTP